MRTVGLANLGNTCFLNACLQALFKTTELVDALGHRRTNSGIVNEWLQLYRTKSSMPNQFVATVHRVAKDKGRDLFTGWSQNDMPEFLLLMIECFHEAICRKVVINIKGTKENPLDELAVQCYKMFQDNYSKEYSDIIRLFYGIYVSELVSSSNVRQKPESFFVLDLPIPNCSASLYDCFDLYTASEELSGVYNETTKTNETVEKRIRFWNFPAILVIVLKRFSANGRTKNGALISCPIESLNLSKYVIGYNPNSYIYDLYAVCNHMGGVGGGHYTAFVKDDDQWLDCNDMSVSPIDVASVISPMSYCLFYRKKIRA